MNQLLSICPHNFNAGSNCFITPYISPGHAFVKINCEAIGINKVVGFYPIVFYGGEEKDTSIGGSNNYRRSEYPNWSLLVRHIKEGFGASGLILYALNVLKSGFFNRKAGEPIDITKYLWRIDLGLKKFLIAKAAILPYNILDSFNPGEVVDDSEALSECFQLKNCLKHRFSISPHQAIEAVKYIDEFTLMSLSDQSKFYNIFNRNCVDFVMGAMDSAGIPNFEERLQISNSMSFIQRIRSIAWNYLYIKKWWIS